MLKHKFKFVLQDRLSHNCIFDQRGNGCVFTEHEGKVRELPMKDFCFNTGRIYGHVQWSVDHPDKATLTLTCTMTVSGEGGLT